MFVIIVLRAEKFALVLEPVVVSHVESHRLVKSVVAEPQTMQIGTIASAEKQTKTEASISPAFANA